MKLETLLFLLLHVYLTLAKQPNIIFLMTDDMGSADVKFRNPESPFVTDNIDNLAAESVRLSNYYVHPSCSPTRASLMTGRYSANVGVSIAIVPGSPVGLDDKYPTFPEHLSREGYETYLVGKWHLGSHMKKHHPLQRGFNHFYGLLGGGFNHYTKQAGSGRFDFWRDFDVEYENKTHSTDLFNKEAIRVVRKHVEDKKKSPFFLYLSHAAPHDPLQAPQRFQEMCAHIPNYRRMMSCAMMAGVDEGLGQLLQLLRENGELDNTIIAFSSDNGGVPYAGAYNYPFRGGKLTTYEGGVRAPGFIYSPKHFGKGFDFQGLFHVSDFFPTFMSMIKSSKKIEKANELDGMNQLPALASRGKKIVRESVHINRDFDRDNHAFRKGPWKIIVGRHFVPFVFNRWYAEPTGSMSVENGDWKDRLCDIFVKAMELISPSYNILFLQYFSWALVESFSAGGPASMGFRGERNLVRKQRKSDLEYWRSKHGANPMVSLFNLDKDPEERFNVAADHPELVESLLQEAETHMKNAPEMLRGDLVYSKSPAGPDAGFYSDFKHMGTEHTKVTPSGIFLPDDFDYSKVLEAELNPVRPFFSPVFYGMLFKMFFLYVLTPMVLLRMLMRSTQTN